MLDQKELACLELGKLNLLFDSHEIIRALDELTPTCEIISDLENAVASVNFFKTKKWSSVYELGVYRIVNYLIARLCKPKVFIETGVLHGITSNFILTALRLNERGKLISIDLPSYAETGPSNQDGFLDTLPPGKEPGWTISQKNLSYWELMIGKSTEVLPKLFGDAEQIDIFLHDSEHTYATMTFELTNAWEKLRSDGIIICDNIDCNSAFEDFCRSLKKKPIRFAEGLSHSDPFKYRFGLLSK